MELKEEALLVVAQLNEFLSNKISASYPYPKSALLQYVTDEYSFSINFMGVIIWSENLDVRYWISQTEKEPLKDCIIRQVTCMCNTMHEAIHGLE